MSESVPGFVLAFHDGEVSSGVQNLKSAIFAQVYGYGDTFTLYYNVAGTLVTPVTQVERGDWDYDGFAYFTYSFFVDEQTTVPFYSFILRIDGNA